MMVQTITLSIQEIVGDFESLLRFHERITTLMDLEMLEDDDAMEFKSDMVKMARKYIPNYEKHLNHEYFSDKISDLKKGQMLANVLYDNFREIFYGLV